MPEVRDSGTRLSQALERALSQRPSMAGRRLRSERDLVDLLQVNHSALRRSLGRLVDKGVLVRRHGSGTYVRRVPVAPPPGRSGETDLPIAPGMLFADFETEQGVPAPLAPTHQQQQLQIGLWIDFASTANPARQALLNGIVHRTEEAGHRVTIHSLVDRGGQDLSEGELAKRLRNTPSDGYLVGPWHQDRFLSAAGGNGTRVVFFHDSSEPISHEPFVFMDSHEAVTRAVHLLAAEGYRRIGLLGLDIPDMPVGPFLKVYDRAMEDAGLEYRATEFAEPNLGRSMAATRRFLARPDSPDAVYVADDVVLAGAAEAWEADGVVPGRDLGVITYSTPNLPLPPNHRWSRMDFDIEGFGEAVVNSLLRSVQTAGTRVNSHAIHASWVPGETHQRGNVP